MGDCQMSGRIVVAMLCLLSALNVIVFMIEISMPSRAAGGGLTYQDLIRDSDFTRAVKSIAESCTVNVDIGKLKCQ
jgi:hypothetical protein